MKYERNKPDKDGYEWTDWNCQGCGIYKMLKKRSSDGKLLCKNCSKNKSLTMMFKDIELNSQNKAKSQENNKTSN